MKLKNYEWKEGDGIFKGDFTDEQWEFLKNNLTHRNGWYSTREGAFKGDTQYVACFRKFRCLLVLGSGNKLYINNIIKPEDLFEEETTDYEPSKIYQLTNEALSYGGAWTDALGDRWHYGEAVLADRRVLINGQMYHKSHFNVAIHYDEDEDSLSCEEDLMNEGYYFDLSEHTEEQIRYIGKYFKFFDLENLLTDNWEVVFLHSDGDLVGDYYREKYHVDNKIHYNDLFY